MLLAQDAAVKRIDEREERTAESVHRSAAISRGGRRGKLRKNYFKRSIPTSRQRVTDVRNGESVNPAALATN
jgi:hypothetical protein